MLNYIKAMIMNNINKRLIIILNEMFKGNVSEFARASNIPQPTLNNIVGNRFSSPSAENLERLLNSIELINANWLLTGKGEMLIKNDISTSINIRINEIAIRYFDGNSLKMANALSTNENNIQNYRLDREQAKLEFLNKLVNVLNINQEWLLTGKGEMLKTPEISEYGISEINIDYKEKYDELNKKYVEILEENRELSNENRNLHKQLAELTKKRELQE
jgi:transcriptional regulator with XRE-family HTH domain